MNSLMKYVKTKTLMSSRLIPYILKKFKLGIGLSLLFDSLCHKEEDDNCYQNEEVGKIQVEWEVNVENEESVLVAEIFKI